MNKDDDFGEGVKQLEQVKENLQIESLHGVTHSADGGFGSLDLLEYYEKNGINGLVPQKMFNGGRYSLSLYVYDKEKDAFIATDGITTYRKKGTCQLWNGIVQHIYLPDILKKGFRKSIVVESAFFLREKMRKRFGRNREEYRKRALTIERIFGDMKHNKNVKTEMYLWATSYNIGRFCSFLATN